MSSRNYKIMNNDFSRSVDCKFIENNVYVSGFSHLFSMSSWREAKSLQELHKSFIAGTDKERASADGRAYKVNYEDFNINGIE